MTDKDKMILEQYVSEDAFDIPDMAPTAQIWKIRFLS